MMLHPFQPVPYPLPPSAKTLPRSTERRLRKMTRIYRPTCFHLSVRAQVLCVGTQIVYRAELTVGMRAARLLVPSWRNRHAQSWVIALSLDKFHRFFFEARALLQHPAIAALLVPRRRSLSTPIEQFFRRVASILRRSELLRATFESPSLTTAHMSDSKHTVEAFLDECWRALEVVLPVLAARVDVPTGLSRETLTLYVLLRDLLAFPESLLEADQVYAKAILSLRDVDAATLEARASDCSICLEAMACGHAGHGGERATASTSTSTSTSPSTDRLFAVQLPCAHVFHENCIMAWLRQNPTCPECRARADVGRSRDEQQEQPGDPLDADDEMQTL